MSHRSRLSQPIQFVSSNSPLQTVPKPQSNGNAVAEFYKTIVSSSSSDTAPSQNSTSTSTSATASTSTSAPRQSKPGELWCKTCAMAVPAESYDRHIKGTAHLVSAETLPAPDLLVLNATNVGFKMLRASGWEYEQGLGVSNQGRRHPIATTLKQDRRGIGCPGDRRKRVTHLHYEIDRTARERRRAERASQPLSGKEIARRDREESRKRTALLHYLNE
ncbi:G patch domain and ankyrin repeat-containing protein 1 [Apophysomyces ossiformis]|uniref:G patch domain and ankyrin repeat-containing protein 1 n=1 Tax=Apophysomyces ossiformis TaxID=679940 RepID=A0A8H7BWT4_9FUNG|nr:G patch domain and ankyrin repeat-containing protein 1 [Apophysomyces ossiformis]